ncbi:MAG: PorV/PorQ family protein [Endomicrobiales bacterium]|nr:PorV/PorQ family protein [Endomicrobiales bacterium]
MNIKKLLSLSMFLLIFLQLPAYSLGGKPGEIFEWGMGGRALGMGKAFTAAADDSSASYWNPANMPRLNSQEISMSHNMLWEGTGYDSLSYVYPTPFRKAFGVNLIKVGNDGFVGTDENNIPTGNFSVSDTAIKLGYGQFLSRSFSVGTAFNYLTRNVGVYSSSLMSLDLGATYFPDPRKSFALKVGNIFGFSSNTDDQLPLNLRVGYAQKFFNDKLTASFDYQFPDRWYSGFEVSLNPLFLRLGLNYEEMSTGIGYIFKNNYRLDYALAHSVDLGLSHRISFTFKFGKDITYEREKIIADAVLHGDQQVSNGKFNKALSIYESVLSFEDKPVASKRSQNMKALMEQAELNDVPSKLSESENKAADYECKAVYDYMNNMLTEALLNIQQAISINSDNQTYKAIEAILKKEGAVITDEDLSPDTKVAMKLHRAISYFQDGKYDLAAKECQEVLRLEPDNVIAHMRLGSTYYAVGIKDKAIIEWRRALELDPNNTELQQFIQQAGEK